jgi:hypothetical protein
VPSIETASLTPLESPRPPQAGAPSDPDESLTESLQTSSVSWGKSQRLLRPRSRTLIYWAILGAAAVAGLALAGGLFFRSQDGSPAVPVATSKVAAPSAPAPTGLAASNATASAVLLVPIDAVEPPGSAPPLRTVSVIDLPTAAAPPPAAPSDVSPREPKLVEVPHPAPKASTAAAIGIPKAIAAFAASASAMPRAPTNCSPPFYFDELGLKIFKPECVN